MSHPDLLTLAGTSRKLRYGAERGALPIHNPSWMKTLAEMIVKDDTSIASTERWLRTHALKTLGQGAVMRYLNYHFAKDPTPRPADQLPPTIEELGTSNPAVFQRRWAMRRYRWMQRILQGEHPLYSRYDTPEEPCAERV